MSRRGVGATPRWGIRGPRQVFVAPTSPSGRWYIAGTRRAGAQQYVHLRDWFERLCERPGFHEQVMIALA